MKYVDLIKELERLISVGREIFKGNATHKDPAFRKWRYEAESIVDDAKSQGFNIPGEFNSSRRQYLALWMSPSTQDNVEALRNDLNDSLVELEFIVKQFQKYGEACGADTGDLVTALDAAVSVEGICSRIPLVIRQLRDRYDGRHPHKVDDEYDLQDLLHGLLHLFFDDVRPEEHTPSYAGKSTPMDFLLKKESIVIESKMTRRGPGAKEVGEQLIIDIAHYKSHPDCKSLFCPVYDPDHRVDNPRGIENDLSKKADGMTVSVFVVPR